VAGQSPGRSALVDSRSTDGDLSRLRGQVTALASRFPLYPELTEGAR
jgi:hypothetical protein